MQTFDTSQLFFILPELILLSGVSFILILNLFLNKSSQLLGYYLSQALLIITIIASFYLVGEDVKIFSNSFVVDNLATTLKIVMLIFSLILMQYTKEYLIKKDLFKNEYFSLILLSIFGMMIMASGSNLITLYLGLEIMSLTLYSLIAMANTRILAIEASLKYFILGAIASGILLYGMSLLYGITGSLDIATISANVVDANPLIVNFSIVFIVIGIAFKFGAVPFHMWVPDVYQGSNMATTMFLSSIPKIATAIMFIRILVEGLGSSVEYWSSIVLFLGVFSVAVGTLVALVQTNIKRLLAYSTIAHIGFILVAFSIGSKDGYSAAIYYTIIYVFTTIAAFGILIALGQNKSHNSNIINKAGTTETTDTTMISSFSGISKTNPMLAFLMLIVMLSMAGVPPIIGFYAKLAVLLEVVNSGQFAVAGVLMVLAVIGAYYYLKIIKVMYFDDNKNDQRGVVKNSFLMNLFLLLNVFALVVLGIFPDYFTDLIYQLF